MLAISFLLATSALLLQGVLLPHLSLLAFAPFLALVSMRPHLPSALWLSALAGAMTDLFSDDPIGLHALNFVCVVALLSRLQKLVSSEHPFHLSFFTALLSSLSTAFHLILLFLFDRRVPFDGKWILTDLLGMPMIDALYAFVWFAAPLTLIDFLRKKWVVFCLKRKNPSPVSH